MAKTIAETLRQKIGCEAYAVAKAAGVEYVSLFRFIKGERSLHLETVEALCKHFNLVLTEAKSNPRTDDEHRTDKPAKQRRKRAEKQ